MRSADGQVRDGLVFLLDVDNTLLDNDRLKQDVAAELDRVLGPVKAATFWSTYESVRSEKDYVDYPTTLRRVEVVLNDPVLSQKMYAVLDSIDFVGYLYSGVMEVLRHLKELGQVVILSDGDQVFQRKKIEASGLAAAVDDNVLIYVHKEQELTKVFGAYPAAHYVAVDDKPRIIAALEQDCPDKFTTILVVQGKYARDDDYVPKADYTVAHIADLLKFDRATFVSPERYAPRAD